MKQIVKKGCVTLELRLGFLIVCIASLIIFGGLGFAFPSVFKSILKSLVKEAAANPTSSLKDLITPFVQMADNLNHIMRILGIATFISSILLLVSWFLMNKYAGKGPDTGIFSCFAAANPMNINKRKRLKWWMMPWLVCACLFILAMAYVVVDVIITVVRFKLGAVALIVPPLIAIIIALIQAYCIAVVVSYYCEQTNASM